MKPNSPLDRDALLRLVDQSLDEIAAARSQQSTNAQTNGSSEKEGTLGIAVRRTMALHSIKSDRPKREVVNTDPVPLSEVAAYVDGTLTDQNTIDAITETASTDPGLMMEIVAARKCQRETDVPKLSDSLRSRLIALQLPNSSADGDPAKVQVSDRSETIDPSRTSDSEAVAPVVIQSTPLADSQPSKSKSREMSWGSILAFASAAAIVVAIGWWMRSGVTPDQNAIANVPENGSDSTAVDPETGSSGGSKDPAEPILAENAVPEAAPNPETKQSPTKTIDLTPKEIVQDDPVRIETQPMVAVEPVPGLPVPDRPPMSPDSSDSIAPQPDPKATHLVARWTQIDGLLLRSDQSLGPAESESSDSVVQSVSTGASFGLASESDQTRLRLQTLPLCRAKAEFDGGGQLVLAADTRIDLTHGGAINLLHGSFALLGFTNESLIRIGQNINNSVTLESQPGAAVVVRKTVSGLEVDVTGSPTKLNGQVFEDSKLNVEGPRQLVSRLDDAPQRLPRWTRERVDRIEVGRNVLTQLSGSTNVRSSIMQSLRSGAAQGTAAATLRGWLVASSSDDLLRLIASPDPLIRDAALQHLRTVNPADPRHRFLWRSLQSRKSNGRTATLMRSFFVDIWRNQRPNATRRDQLLRMVQTPDPIGRVTANYLLQSFYGPGPRFDLNASQAARVRAANAWRTVINRVE